jgi:hypothetical protein
MPVAWTIKGESGKAFDATVRSLEAAEIEAATLDFRSLSDDVLSFVIAPEDVTAATIPELAQEMTLYRDGVQFFHGNVTGRPITLQSDKQVVQVVVSGPWWWMERINFTSTKTDGTGATAERISYVFGTTSGGSNLKTSIEAAIDRAITLGVPMQRGTVATFFDVPRITLNQGNCGQVLAELVRLVPDTMVWFDYSTTPVTINVSRRGSATTRTLDADSGALQSISINPIQELQVSQVRLPYVTRDVAGRTEFQEQASGTPATGKVQILTISGPEIDTFIPNDLLDSFQIQTIASSSASGIRDLVLDLDSQWKAAAEKHSINFKTIQSGIPFGSDAIKDQRYREALFLARGIGAQSTSSEVNPNDLIAKSADGQIVSISGKHLLLTTDLPFWIDELPDIIEKVTLTGQIGFRHQRDTGSGTTLYNLPFWFEDIQFSAVQSGFTSNQSSGNAIWFYYYTYAIEGYLINNSYPTLTTLYRPADYTFIEPPANLAANLKAAQDWLPYEGDIEIVEEDVGAVRYRGCKVNISNSLTDLAAMGALVASERLDIAAGTTTITLGQPPRLDFRTFVDRVRKTPQDNFEYV